MANYRLLVEIPKNQVNRYLEYVENALLPYHFDTNYNEETNLLLNAIDDLVEQDKLPRGSGIEDLETYTEGELHIIMEKDCNYRSVTMLEWFDYYRVEGCMSKKEILEKEIEFSAVFTTAFVFLSDGSITIETSDDQKEYMYHRVHRYFDVCSDDRYFAVCMCHY